MVKVSYKITLHFCLAIILTFGITVSFQSLLADWTPPLNTPPTCNFGDPGCDAPIHQGGNTLTQALVAGGADPKIGVGNDFGTAYPGPIVNPANPNSLIHLIETSPSPGTPNAEIDIQSVPGPDQHWGIYQVRDDNAGTAGYDEAGDLRFWQGNDLVSFDNDTGNVGIGTTNPGTNKLEVVGGPIKATGGLIIETRAADPPAASLVDGMIWLIN